MDKELRMLKPFTMAAATQKQTQLSSTHPSCLTQIHSASWVHFLRIAAIIVLTRQHHCEIKRVLCVMLCLARCAQLRFAATIITIIKVTAIQSTGYLCLHIDSAKQFLKQNIHRTKKEK